MTSKLNTTDIVGILTETPKTGMTYVGWSSFVSPKTQKEHKVLHFEEDGVEAQVIMPAGFKPGYTFPGGKLSVGMKVAAWWEKGKKPRFHLVYCGK